MLNMNSLCVLPFARGFHCTVLGTVPNRFYSQELRTIKSTDVSAIKRGTGGRSSFNGNVVTVFGATGFLGRYICNQLGKRGTQLIIPYRCDFDEKCLKNLKLMGDLGQVLFQPFDLKDSGSIQKAIKYSNIVINLIGRNYETKNFSFDEVHNVGARRIAKACRELNIERLIHFSDLNVDKDIHNYYLKKTKFHSSKSKGECAVFDEFPDATVFRPSCVYGFSDNFLSPLLSDIRQVSHCIPIYGKGKNTFKHPVFASDVALGVIKAIENYDSCGKIYQILGPQKFYLHDLAYYCGQVMQLQGYGPIVTNLLLSPKFFVKHFINSLLNILFVAPPRGVCLDQLEIEATSDIVDKRLPTLTDLGVSPAFFEDKVPGILLQYFMGTRTIERYTRDVFNVDSLGPKAISDFKINFPN